MVENTEDTENTETDEKGRGPDQDPENPFLSGLCVLCGEKTSGGPD
jgi:antirestriction protein ArdC